LALPGARPAGVTLVGAGPGGADLITLPGWQALHAADVVVTDRLSREAIVETVLAHARAGRRVVRLKGGDPFVFGRGGEEVLACARAGIPCMVVPGLSSVASAPTSPASP
jgi:siroheme synthase